MKTNIILPFLLIALTASSQPSITFDLGTPKKLPAVGTSVGYRYHIAVAEIGIKSNWQEYNTAAYASAGAHVGSKLWAEATGGISYLTNIPQQDRRPSGVTKGYTTSGIWYGMVQGRVGYGPVYSYGYYGKVIWVGVGLRFEFDK